LLNIHTYAIILIEHMYGGAVMEIHHGRGYVYAIEYHLVWCVKYRKKIITQEIEAVLKDLLNEYAQDHGFSIREFNTDRDHIHMLVEASPQVYIPDIMRGMKGTSARKLFKSFPYLKEKYLWGGHLWSPSYFVATVSDHTEQQISEYIRSQKEK